MRKKKHSKGIYINVTIKFIIAHIFSLAWMALSIYLSMNWVKDLSEIIGLALSIILITGIAYIPGYINFFTIISLLLDRQPKFKVVYSRDEVSVLIACYNEENSIEQTLEYVRSQEYNGEIKVYVIDNASTDKTSLIAKEVGSRLGLNITVLYEGKKGKFNALNNALEIVDSKYIITLDADTLLHRFAIRNIVARINSAPSNIAAVAGSVLVKNSRDNLLARLQEWDYFLGIASIKRLQGLYQGTLVAQGAYSIYKTQVIKEIGGWEDAIGEDIVLTWKMLSKNYKVYYEPTAIAFTDVPISIAHFQKQRSRWGRGMIEGLRCIKPWDQPILYVKYLTGVNLLMPFIDVVYTFVWMPGLILALFGKFYIVGPYTLLVLPLALIQNYILYRYQKRVFKNLHLNVRKNIFGLIIYVIFYQMIMSPISIIGYTQELFRTKRTWK